MRQLAQFTTSEGRRIGIPPLSGIIILDVSDSNLPAFDGQPDGARSLVRFIVAGEAGARVAWVKDSFKHVLTAMPLSAAGPWAHVEDAVGRDVALPRNSVGAYEEVGEDLFSTTLMVPTGPVTIALKTSFEDMEKHIGFAAADMPEFQVEPRPEPEIGESHVGNASEGRSTTE